MTIIDAQEILVQHGLTVELFDSQLLIVRNAYRNAAGEWEDELVQVTPDGRIYAADFCGSIYAYLGY